jgi:choline dehydrogenase-like flavoprotein
VLGHYLFDQIYVKNVVQAVVPEAKASRKQRGITGGAGYVVRFRNLKPNQKENGFIRGYTYDFGSGGTPNPRYIPKYGEPLLRELAELQGTSFSLTTMGEVLPRFENQAQIDPELKDAWGIPMAEIDCEYKANEVAMLKDILQSGSEMLEKAGFKDIYAYDSKQAPGLAIHEMGSARMGKDPKTSVLNSHNQVWDVKNVFVTDGACMTSTSTQNPTLTYMALSARAADFAVGELKKGNI